MLLVTSALFGMSRVRGSKQEQYLQIDILSLPTVGYKQTSYKIKNGTTIPANGYIIYLITHYVMLSRHQMV